MLPFFLAAAKLTWLSIRHPNTSHTLVIQDGKVSFRGERVISSGITELTGDIPCEFCHGSGACPDREFLFQCRVLPPWSAQMLHELLQDRHPDHDEVACHCCCMDCPGWTRDEEAITEEEIRDLIPCHDYRSGKPFPLSCEDGLPGSARDVA